MGASTPAKNRPTLSAVAAPAVLAQVNRDLREGILVNGLEGFLEAF
jgi:hypothetical protein